MSDELWYWQETLEFEGTKEEADAAYLLFKAKKAACHFVMGKRPKPKPKT